jgi:polysaccharide export outer membrane protein
MVASSWLFFQPPSMAADESYRLAPGDRIAVTVIGQPELSSDVQVDGDKNVVLPLIGVVRIGDLSLAESQNAIRDRFADGYLANPVVTVRATELRPIYVMGDVKNPGAYPFRFGTSARGAVALAGGYGESAVLPATLAAELIAADERLHQLTLERATLTVREARLTAQRDGQKSFTPPISKGVLSEPQMDAIIETEKQAIAAQSAILDDDIKLLEAQRPRLQDEIKAISSQMSVIKDVAGVTKQESDNYKELLKQGLSSRMNAVQARILRRQPP